VSTDTYTVEPSSSTKETTVDNGGSQSGGGGGVYKKAAAAVEGRPGRRYLGHAAAEKLSAESSTPSAGASTPTTVASLPKITASAFWDMIVGRGARTGAMSESERRFVELVHDGLMRLFR